MNNPERILLCVDDEALVLNALKRSLRKEPYQMFFASSAMEGIEFLSRYKIQVVVTDYRMPGMNGLEFIAEIKEKYPEIVTVLLSGYTDPEKMSFLGECDRNIFKPWDDEKLKEEIKNCFEMYPRK